MESQQEKALVDIVKAWEKLSGGLHSIKAIQAWLVDDMKPAIDGCRAALKASSLQPSPNAAANE